MGRGIARFFVHTVSVETFLGSGTKGKAYSDPVDLLCFVDGGTKATRTTNGDLIVAAAPVYAPLAAASALPIESRVTLPGEKDPRKVVAVTRHDSGSLGLPDHIEVTLQ